MTQPKTINANKLIKQINKDKIRFWRDVDVINHSESRANPISPTDVFIPKELHEKEIEELQDATDEIITKLKEEISKLKEDRLTLERSMNNVIKEKCKIIRDLEINSILKSEIEKAIGKWTLTGYRGNPEGYINAKELKKELKLGEKDGL